MMDTERHFGHGLRSGIAGGRHHDLRGYGCCLEVRATMQYKVNFVKCVCYACHHGSVRRSAPVISNNQRMQAEPQPVTLLQ